MKTPKIITFCGFLMLLCVGFISRAQTSITFSGPNEICVNSLETYTVNSPTIGVSYVWSASLGTVQGTGTGNSASVLWGSAAGLGTVTVNGYNTSNVLVETGSQNVQLVALARPSIRTSFKVACIKAYTNDTSDDGAEYQPDSAFLDDKYSCPKVCEDMLVTYTAVAGSALGVFWSVTGGTIIGSSTDWSVSVLWGPAGGGNISVTSYYGACSLKRNICIDIIEKPMASFAVLPNTDPVEDCDTFDVCVNSRVGFKNLSTATANSQIIKWYWDFGDGTASGQKHPSPHTYTASGIYQVRLIATNECGCVDTFCAHINVIENPGPDIACQAVACENDSVMYCTGVRCANYAWGVVGGTVISNDDTCIKVAWDNLTPSEPFGYISLSVDCDDKCPAYTTIKIPVVQSDPEVTGPTKLCVGNQYKFSIPLWAGTEYNWGVIGNPGAIVNGERKGNEVILKFATAGSYQVHITWKNHIALCGGDKTFGVTVYDNDQIVGDNAACVNNSTVHNYSMSSTNSADWKLIDPNGSITTSSGTTFGTTFPIAGQYQLIATNYCADPMLIEVTEITDVVDTVIGRDSVCLDEVVTYGAGTSASGTVFSWSVTGGTIIGNPTQSTITVKWDGTAPHTVSVRNQSTKHPFCEGPLKTVNVVIAPLNPNITGPDTVCSDTYLNYFDANYKYPGATFKWKVIPETTGNIVGDIYSNKIEFKSNYFASPTASSVVVEMKHCDSIIRDTFQFWIVPKAIPSLTGPDTICSGIEATYTTQVGASGYSWNQGYDYDDFFSTNTIDHTYWNESGAPITYTMSVFLTGSNGMTNCPPNGLAEKKVVVLSGPQVDITTTDRFTYCDFESVSTLLSSVVTGTGPFTYEWRRNGNVISGATSSTYAATIGGGYQVLVTDAASGCKGKGDFMIAISPCDTCMYAPTIDSPIFASCGSFSTDATWPGTPGSRFSYWSLSGGSAYDVVETNSTYAAKVRKAGRYSLFYSRYFDLGGGDSCEGYDFEEVIVPLVPDFNWSFECDYANSRYIATFNDQSTFMNPIPGIGNIVYLTQWEVVGSGLPPFIGLGFRPILAPGTYTIRLTVGCSSGGVIVSTCNLEKEFIVPAWPSVAVDHDPTSVCEGVPVSFSPLITPSSAGFSKFEWDFGDNAYSKLKNTSRVYEYKSILGASPNQFAPYVVATDQFGCVFTSPTVTVDIHENILNGTVSGGTRVCNGPVSLGYVPVAGTATQYMWSYQNGFIGTNPQNVISSGSYFVTVEDANQCRYVTNREDVEIINLQNTGITGDRDYCAGDPVFLSGFVGTDPRITYSWKRGGTPIFGNDPFIIDPGLSAGTYSYSLSIIFNDGSISCTTNVGPVTISIYNPPAPPTVTALNVLDCQKYELELVGNAPGSGYLQWINGPASSNYVIYDGGPYRLLFTADYGCQSWVDTTVPVSPESQMGWFPDGCYQMCATQFPFTLYGPLGTWDGWEWNAAGGASPVSSGSNSSVLPYTVNAADAYTLTLDNGLCSLTSQPMSIEQVPCPGCPDITGGGYSFTCDPSNPGGYNLQLTLNNPFFYDLDVTVALGSGPATPFQLNLPTGSHMFNVYVVTMSGPPSTIEISYKRRPDGRKCFLRIPVDPGMYQYPCTGWPSQKPAKNPSSVAENEVIPTGMMVFPNPADQIMKISYDYGVESNGSRKLTIFDMMGRKIKDIYIQRHNDVQSIDVSGWPQGNYIVRMEENGQAVHTARIAITH